MPTAPSFAPNTVDQTVDFGGATWKGQPGGGWQLQRENPQATNYSSTPSKGDINPDTGKAYAINPSTGVWDDNYWATVAEPQMKAQYGDAGAAGGSSGGQAAFQQPSIDLPKLYQSLHDSSGITDLEKQFSDKTNAYNDAVAKVKDNPYLSEATLSGRISKLNDKYNADRTAAQDQIAMKKADIQTQLDLQTKQFDINSQQAQQSFQQFQALLSAGALDNASGADIANLTRSTGLSSSMIQSAIGANRAKNAPKVNTQVIQFDDGDNTGFAVINSDTGEVIKKQIVAASKPSAIEQKAITNGTSGGSGGTVSSTKQIAADKAAAPSSLTNDVKKNRMTLGTAMALYQQYGMSKQQIYNIYVANTPYKQTDATKKADKARYGVK